MPVNTCTGHKATSCCRGENVQRSLDCSSTFGLHQSFHHFLSNSGTEVSAVFYPEPILKQKSVQVQKPDDVPAHDNSTPLGNLNLPSVKMTFIIFGTSLYFVHLVFVVQIKQRGRGHAAPGHGGTAHRGTLAF